MGLIKWLRKEGHFSPASLKPKLLNLTVSPTYSHKSEIRRNESYLKALAKFTKWRQLHLARHRQQQSEPQTQFQSHSQEYQTEEQDNKHEHGDELQKNMNISDLLYEEIDLKTPLFASVYENEASLLDLAKQPIEEDGKTLHCNMDTATLAFDDKMYSEPEPEYALPYSSTNEILVGCCTESKVVTDLDKSLVESAGKTGIYSIEENHQQYTNSCDMNMTWDLFNSELLICAFTDIVPTKTKVTNGYLKHGTVDAIEISYVRDYNDYNAMLLNFRNLRKLRHPNITLLMGACLSTNGTLEAIILEPLKCTLFERIHWQKKKIATNQCLLYALQLANAIIYLHKRSMVHNNIHSMCVLLCKNGNVVKLAGFESSTRSNVMNFPTCNSRVHDQSFYDEIPTDECVSITSHRNDINGVCRILYEMLNCVVPHSQLSQYATLPMYERERCLPFKNVLERGLQISEDCIKTAEVLRDELKHIQYKMLKVKCQVQAPANERNVAFKKSRNKNRIATNSNVGAIDDEVTAKRKFNVSIRIASNRN